jgi:hypothetical protein
MRHAGETRCSLGATEPYCVLWRDGALRHDGPVTRGLSYADPMPMRKQKAIKDFSNEHGWSVRFEVVARWYVVHQSQRFEDQSWKGLQYCTETAATRN